MQAPVPLRFLISPFWLPPDVTIKTEHLTAYLLRPRLSSFIDTSELARSDAQGPGGRLMVMANSVADEGKRRTSRMPHIELP
jgi:hypothetical protein